MLCPKRTPRVLLDGKWRLYSIVNKRKSLIKVYLSRTVDNCWEVLQLILYIKIKGGDVRRGYVKFIGGRLGRWQKAKWRHF